MKLYSIECGNFKLDGGAMFGIIPKPIWEREVPSDSLNRVGMVTRSLLLCSDDKKILIDTTNNIETRIAVTENGKLDDFEIESNKKNAVNLIK